MFFQVIKLLLFVTIILAVSSCTLMTTQRELKERRATIRYNQLSTMHCYDHLQDADRFRECFNTSKRLIP